MFYVNYITEYPIFEPAEGGYYYSGETVQESIPCKSWKKANRIYKEWKDWFREEYEYENGKIYEVVSGGVGKYINPTLYFSARYIGEGARVEITRKQPMNHGWHPYE